MSWPYLCVHNKETMFSCTFQSLYYTDIWTLTIDILTVLGDLGFNVRGAVVYEAPLPSKSSFMSIWSSLGHLN